MGCLCQQNSKKKKKADTHVWIFILKRFSVSSSLELAFCKNVRENEMANMI